MEYLLKSRDGRTVGRFEYRPKQISAYRRRCTDLAECIDLDSLRRLTQIDISADGHALTPEGEEILAAAQNTIYQALNRLLGYDGAAEKIFAEISPFASVGGTFFCIPVIDKIVEVVTQGNIPDGFRKNFQDLWRK